MFLDMGADINATDHHGYTPLFYAAMSNNANTAATLIRRGADLEVRGSACRRSVLHIAAMYGSNDVIKILLDKVRSDDVIKILLDKVHSDDVIKILLDKVRSDDVIKILLD